MGAQKGKDLLLKAGDGAGGFTTIMGLRTRALTFGAATIDVTDADSDGGWRELLSGGGIRHASVSGSGVFKDAASDSLAQTLFFSGEARDWQVVVPGFGTLAGPFQITSLAYAGDYQGEVTFNLALESAGAISFTAGA
jgi:TP901-1 family phage major tail protein